MMIHLLVIKFNKNIKIKYVKILLSMFLKKFIIQTSSNRF